MIRWISYTQQNIPGNQSFTLGFHASLREAREAFMAYCGNVGYEDCSMTLYSTIGGGAGSLVESAKEFDGIGCPFDYPDRLIERGPCGGVKIVKC